MKELSARLALLNETLAECKRLFNPDDISGDNNLLSEYSNVDLWGRLTSFEQIIYRLSTDLVSHHMESAFIIAKEVLLDCYNYYLISGGKDAVHSMTAVQTLLLSLDELFPEGELEGYIEKLANQ